MTVIERINREPAALLGLGTAAVGLFVLLDVLTPEVGGSVGIVLGALVACLRYFVTPSAEVVVQWKPGGEVVRGAALPDGAPIPTIEVRDQAPGEHRADRRSLFDEGSTS